MAELEQLDEDIKEENTSLCTKPSTWKGFLSNTIPNTFPVFKSRNVKKVALGGKHAAFLTSEHEVFCYGSGEYGQLGHKKFSDVTKQPVLVKDIKGENVIDVVCGLNHTGVVCADGIVFCWGDSNSGQCGTGLLDRINTPQQVEFNDPDHDPVITQLACGDMHTLALSTKGEVWAWGIGHQLGLGTGSNSISTPSRLSAFGERKVLNICCGAAHSLAVVQKVRSPKAATDSSVTTEDVDVDATLCPKCSQEMYSFSDLGDTVFITETHVCKNKDVTEVDETSTRSFSPDSIDVQIPCKPMRKDVLKKSHERKMLIEAEETGSVLSTESQGTYVLDESEKDTVDAAAAHEELKTPVATEDVPDDPEKDDSELTGSFPTGRSAKDFLEKQMASTNRAIHGTAKTSKDKLLASLPTSVTSNLEKLLNYKFNFMGKDQTSSSLSPSTELLHQEADFEVEEPELNVLDMSCIPVKGRRSHLEDLVDEMTMVTEVWSWGKGNVGQLGQADVLDRPQPTVIRHLNNKNIVRVVAGSGHSIAISNSGQVYTWGSNTDGQLGHTGQLAPKKIKIPNGSIVWDAAAGSAHTLLLADGSNNQPDIYYLGKQPSLAELKEAKAQSSEKDTSASKDGGREGSAKSRKQATVSITKGPTVKYAARAKQPERMAFIRKECGWALGVAAAGDSCACVSDRNTNGLVAGFCEFAALERNLFAQLSTVKSTVIRSLQTADISKILLGSIYEQPYQDFLDTFNSVSNLVCQTAVQLTSILQQRLDVSELLLLKNKEEYVEIFAKYSKAVCQLINVAGFSHLGKLTSDSLSKHEAVLTDLVGAELKAEGYGSMLRNLFKRPVDRILVYSDILHRLSQLYSPKSQECMLLRDTTALWDNLSKDVKKHQEIAEETRTFWESCPPKLQENIKNADRRVIRDSRKNSLQLVNASRLSVHWFLLFSDVFVHVQTFVVCIGKKTQSISHYIYPLNLVWAEPVQDSQQSRNTIRLVMAEETLLLSTTTPEEKSEWLWCINDAIDAALSSRQLVDRSDSATSLSPVSNGQRVPPKLHRNGSYKFVSHPKFKDATYEGAWCLGKPHGRGKLTWPDGRFYHGNFLHGVQHGYGISSIPSADGKSVNEKFEGQWLEGKRQVFGTLRYHNGDVYIGSFLDNMRHGHGILECKSPSSLYIGEWQKDKKQGYGAMEDSQRGEKYMGGWQDGYRHGRGFVITLEGLYYEGNFTQNKLTGVGLLATEDGTCYEGELSTGPTLNGKGTLTLPNGDFITGSFTGLWGDGVKVNGVFSKASDDYDVSRKLGKFTVDAAFKWEELFGQCRAAIGWQGDIVKETDKAWDMVAVSMNNAKILLERERQGKGLSSSGIDCAGLDMIPNVNRDRLTEVDLKTIQDYLEKAFNSSLHPLGKLVDNLVHAFTNTYLGIGAHRRLLPYAVDEIKSFVKRLSDIVKVLFPSLPGRMCNGEVPVSAPMPNVEVNPELSYYYDYGMMQQGEENKPEVKPTKDVSRAVQVSIESVMHPLLLPRLYPALFALYALNHDQSDDCYWERLCRLNKQSDIPLMSYLGIHKNLLLLPEQRDQDTQRRYSETTDICYKEAVENLRNLSTSYTPHEKLLVIEKTFEAMDQEVKSHAADHIWNMDDLFPVFQYIVIRARIRHLGSEIQFIEDLMEHEVVNGKLGIMFTTLKACYFQIQNENIPL
ncbi:alsin-like [Anneissia japonica]|uniref:alsin-like n=1 Tax=Anneissia japonica TaxID=1529436 RepID=UPI001425977A|nr:alsin-like [Anneissia japonica]